MSDAINASSGDIFYADQVILPRSFVDGFSNDEARGEMIDAVRAIVRNSEYLSRHLPTLKSHLLFTQAVFDHLCSQMLDQELKDILTCEHFQTCFVDVGRNDLFLKIISACSAVSASGFLNSVDQTQPSFINVDVGLVSLKNRRRIMEDQYIFLPNLSFWPRFSENKVTSKSKLALAAVMDGHGGPSASLYVAKQLPELICQHLSRGNVDKRAAMEQSLAAVEQMFCRRASKIGQVRVGTTVVASLIDLETGHGCVGWLGDSRGDIFKFCRQGVTFSFDVEHLTTPLHKPDEPTEKKRIESYGGFVDETNSIPRINGQLGVSRAIGDLDYKLSGLVNAEPQFSNFTLPEQLDQSHTFEVLLLSSDGLWDGISYSQVGNIICDSLKREIYRKDADWLNNIAYRLSSIAAEKSDDNITCILITKPPVLRLSQLVSPV